MVISRWKETEVIERDGESGKFREGEAARAGARSESVMDIGTFYFWSHVRLVEKIGFMSREREYAVGVEQCPAAAQ